MTNTQLIFNKYCEYKVRVDCDIFDHFQFDIYENSKSNNEIINEVFTLLVIFYDEEHLHQFYKKHINNLTDRFLFAFVLNYIYYNRNMLNFK